MFKKLFGLNKKKNKEEEINQDIEKIINEENSADEECEICLNESVDEAESLDSNSPIDDAHCSDATLEDSQEKEIEEQIEEKPKNKKSFFAKLVSGLDKTRKEITDKIDNLINNYGEIDDDLYEELEEILIMADIGMDTTMKIIDNLKTELVKRKILDSSKVKPVLKDVIVSMLNTSEEAKLIIDDSPSIILIIGVNGAGKTTSIGKIAHNLNRDGKDVLLAAGDTFRAGAIDQLKVWGERTSTNVIAHQEGSDSSAVIFDSIQAAKARKSDVLICDTAGRLHNKKNLMNELEKIFKVINREYPEAKKEILLVLDGTTGQNAINQAKSFREVADITGIVLTKLDGTAKGGVALSIKNELNIPIKYIGVGEGKDDLQAFDPEKFVSALLNL